MNSTPHVSVKTYAVVFLALLGLTALTTAAALVDLGHGLNDLLALAIAVVKALLVILYFMHVRYSDRFTWVLAGIAFFWLAILIGGTLNDFVTSSLMPISVWPPAR